MNDKPSENWKILLVDDDPIFRDGIHQWIDQFLGITTCAECDSGPEVLEAMRRWRPDLAIMELSPTADDGVERIRLMLAERSDLIVLVLSALDESDYALAALRAGAKGYVMKHAPPGIVTEALRKVMDGGIYVSSRLRERLVFQAIAGGKSDFGPPLDHLTDREFEMLRLFALGKNYREIGQCLKCALSTVERDRRRAFWKLQSVSLKLGIRVDFTGFR